jgi:DNA (cytosine-5)-methyltransferase 1
MRGAYYNEIDPFAAAWLRELIKAGHIADGEVDTRSIEDVRPDELRGFVQCHFFAGVGGWSLALRFAGWPDDRAVWTGSCPCQPFSAAGKGDGFADERHLWPAWHWLIEERRPVVVFGEQVESPAGRAWFDLVSTDLEAAGYACGPSDLPVAGVGAPGIRQRLFWVADASSERSNWRRTSEASDGRYAPRVEPERLRLVSRLAHVSSGGLGIDGRAPGQPGHAHECGPLVRMAHPCGEGLTQFSWRWQQPARLAAAGATRGAWADADWLLCTDGKARPVEPGAFPLASGVPARVGRLRGYGNAINPYVAAAFIQAYQEARG